MTEFEHDVVGDIDGGRDRPDTAQHQATTQPPRRQRFRVDPGDRAQRETADAGAGFDGHGQGGSLHRQRRHVSRVDEVQVVGAGDLPGDTANRHPVAAVRGDRQVEHHVAETQHGVRVGAGFGGSGRQHQDAGLVPRRIARAHPEFGGRADHPVGGAAVGLAGGDREIPRQHRPRQCHRHQVADSEIRCPADDVAVLTLAGVDLAGPDRLLELGELLDRGHPGDLQRSGHRPQGDDVLDLVADPDQRALQIVRFDVPSGRSGLHHLAQPAVGKAHQTPTPNGSENRTSPSTMSRMSGIPLRNCRVRSRPQPKAKPE